MLVSQPTLSGHVKALEESYGVTLFRRSSREVHMTEFGRALFEITQRYFASEMEARRLLATAVGLTSGVLRIGADSPFAAIPLLAAFKGRFPKVEVHIDFGNSAEVLDGILDNATDVGILAKIDPDPRLDIVPFRDDRLVVFVDRGHPWTQRRSIKLADIADQNLILREEGSMTREIFERALFNHGIAPASILEMEGREAVREAVAAGLGVGVVCDYEFGHDSRLHKLKVKQAKLKLTECAVCRRDLRTNPVVAAFLDVVQESAEHDQRKAA